MLGWKSYSVLIFDTPYCKIRSARSSINVEKNLCSLPIGEKTHTEIVEGLRASYTNMDKSADIWYTNGSKTKDGSKADVYWVSKIVHF